MLIKGTQCGLIKGLCPNFIPGGVVSLQYAGDTLLFLHNNVRVALNCRWILTFFEKISGMRIKHHKSEFLPINMDNEEVKPFVDILQCVVGKFYVMYLGIPLYFDRPKIEDLQPPIKNLLKRITGVLRKLSFKLVYLASPYLLSFFKFPKWVLHIIDS
jgi:hypothetical protein